MKGLLIKDFKISFKTGYIYYGISLLFLICEIIAIFHNDNFVRGISTLSIVASTIQLSYISPLIMYSDEKYRWNKYEKSLPISKKIIVAEKYIFPYLVIAAYSMINAAIMTWAYGDYHFNIYGFSSFLWYFIKSFFIGMIIPCISIPLCIKFGYLKSKYIKLAIMLLPLLALYTNLSDYIIGNGISKLITNSIKGLFSIENQFEINGMISIAINLSAMILINVISYFLSLSFYKRGKE